MNTTFYTIWAQRIRTFFSAALMILVMVGCSDFELPEEGSLPDLTPPKAAFSTAPDDTDWKTIDFTNLSISTTDYAWDFGDGATSTDPEPSHTFAGEGTYTVQLTCSDKLNQTNTISVDVEVVEPIILFVPKITNPGFDIEVPDDFREGWRNSGLGGVIQITTGPLQDGVRAAKLPSGGDRIGYQLIEVEKGKDYKVSFYYTMKTSPVGDMTMAILGGDVTDPANVAAATIASKTVNDQNDASTYILESVSFNSGTHDMVAIYFSNVGVECRIDSFTITEE